MTAANARFPAPAGSQLVMLANAALFAAGAVLHLGVPLGPLAEPRIVAAAVTETVCALALTAGALTPLYAPRLGELGPALGNVVSLLGIALTVIALALGAGPRTAAIDVAYAVTTVLAVTSLWLLLSENRAVRQDE